jgi:hypothetical protein
VGLVSYISLTRSMWNQYSRSTGQQQFRIVIVILLSKMMLIVIFSLFLNVLLAHLDRPIFLNIGMLEVKKFLQSYPVVYFSKRVEICFVLTEASAFYG